MALGVMRSYLAAFDERDLTRCLEYFADDAEINFHMSVYRGKQQIEQWHKDRFEADLRLLKLEDIVVKGDSVVVEALVTSKKIRAWKIPSLSGEVSVRMDGGRFRSAVFKLRALPW